MSKSMRSRGHVRARQSARTGALEVFVRPEQTLVARFLGLLLRLRAELCVLAAFVAGYAWLSGFLPPWAVNAVLVALALVVLVVPVVRRFVARRCWCVVTRHRVRACFTQTRTMTHDGRMPSLMWARPTPVGERVRVWLPAGLSVKDLEAVSDKLAAACWAREARIEAQRAQAASALIHIIRRDPLAGTSEFGPDLLDHVDLSDLGDNVVPLPARHEVLADRARPASPIEDLPVSGRTDRAQTRKPKQGNEKRDADPGITGFGGMDVSDYV